MVTKAEWIWFDGELVPWDECNVHVLTHCLHYGLGVFEGIRAYQRADGRSAVFRLREHIERLVKGAHMMTLPLEWSVEQLEQACLQTCVANRLRVLRTSSPTRRSPTRPSSAPPPPTSRATSTAARRSRCRPIAS